MKPLRPMPAHFLRLLFFLFNILILIFFYFFEYETIETYARTFLSLINLAVGTVTPRDLKSEKASS